MKKCKIKFGLVGCGRIAQRYSELFRNNEIKNAKLIAVCDIIELRAKMIAKKFKIPYYVSMHKMMKNEKLDVVVILTPSGLHAKHMLKLSKYGKDVVVEKPIALKSNDAQKMIETAVKNKHKLFIVKQNRFNLPIIKLFEAIRKKRFGKIYLGSVCLRWSRNQKYYNQDKWRGTWKFDGGVLANQAIHFIDILIWFLGDIKSVFAKAARFSVNIEAEDTIAVILKFKSGALGIIEATTATRPSDLEGSISILGEKGSVEIDGFALNKIKTWQFKYQLRSDQNIKKYSVNPPNVYGFGHKMYLNHVVDCILKNEKSIIDPKDAKKTIDVLQAIYQSIETNKEVKVVPGKNKSRLGK